MRIILFLILIFCFNDCGFKSPPSPIFPASKTQVDEEIKRRDVEQEKDKKEQEQEKERLNKDMDKDVTNATKIPSN